LPWARAQQEVADGKANGMFVIGPKQVTRGPTAQGQPGDEQHPRHRGDRARYVRRPREGTGRRM
jgi:hypothetical protein